MDKEPPLQENRPHSYEDPLAQIIDRLKDLPRHLGALRSAMAEFGDDFDVDDFASAVNSSEPEPLNKATSVGSSRSSFKKWAEAGFPGRAEANG
jgi:hypothetical protein